MDWTIVKSIKRNYEQLKAMAGNSQEWQRCSPGTCPRQDPVLEPVLTTEEETNYFSYSLLPMVGWMPFMAIFKT